LRGNVKDVWCLLGSGIECVCVGRWWQHQQTEKKDDSLQVGAQWLAVGRLARSRCNLLPVLRRRGGRGGTRAAAPPADAAATAQLAETTHHQPECPAGARRHAAPVPPGQFLFTSHNFQLR